MRQPSYRTRLKSQKDRSSRPTRRDESSTSDHGALLGGARSRQMRHFRIALFDVTSGSADEVLEIVRAGFLPIFENQHGFVRYEIGKLDNGCIVSFIIWETADEARRAVDLANEWVRDNTADRVRLREEHTGDVAWDDPA